MVNESPCRVRTPRQLIALVADANMEATVKGLLGRHDSLQIEPIEFSVVPHPQRDPGVFHQGPDFLVPLRGSYSHAVLFMDREGSGQEVRERIALEQDLEGRLEATWGSRCSAFVFDPELEVWFWSGSPHVDNVLGWREGTPDLRSWLREGGLLEAARTKPNRPKGSR